MQGGALADGNAVEERRLLSGEELEGEMEKGVPGCYMDPLLANSPSRFLDFVCKLFKCCLIGFARSVRVECGLLFVTKKSGKLRMIIDARRANVMFRKPPSEGNSGAACFG